MSGRTITVVIQAELAPAWAQRAHDLAYRAAERLDALSEQDARALLALLLQHSSPQVTALSPRSTQVGQTAGLSSQPEVLEWKLDTSAPRIIVFGDGSVLEVPPCAAAPVAKVAP